MAAMAPMGWGMEVMVIGGIIAIIIITIGIIGAMGLGSVIAMAVGEKRGRLCSGWIRWG